MSGVIPELSVKHSWIRLNLTPLLPRKPSNLENKLLRGMLHRFLFSSNFYPLAIIPSTSQIPKSVSLTRKV